MSDDENVHRLEGSSDQKGGLIITKKPTFKVPQPSLLGLDKLAAAKRREREENARKISFSVEDEDQKSEGAVKAKDEDKSSSNKRNYRQAHLETPTYTGGISKEARDRIIDRLASNKLKEKGVYASTKESTKHRSKDYRGDRYRYERERFKDKREGYGRDDRYKRDRKHHRERGSERESPSSSRDDKTPRFRDEPQTPNLKTHDATAKSSWEDDEPLMMHKKSSWDYPTPSVYKAGEFCLFRLFFFIYEVFANSNFILYL